jgi:hypothetical protein
MRNLVTFLSCESMDVRGGWIHMEWEAHRLMTR